MKKEIIQNLLDQYNSQNDTTKPALTEKYNYQLTESQFDTIMNALKEQNELYEKIKPVMSQLVDHGKVELGTPQSKSLIEAYGILEKGVQNA